MTTATATPASDTIAVVLTATRIEQVLDPRDRDAYRKAASLIHPDRCDDPRANDAIARLNAMMDAYRDGTPMVDEAGDVRWNGWWARYHGDRDLVRASAASFARLTAMRDEASLSFRKYLPATCGEADGAVVATFAQRAVPLAALPRPLPQVHVNWVLSRMLEFSAWLAQSGFSHGCLNPESVFVIPENHGIQVPTFYLLTPLGDRIRGVSGRYAPWYPAAALKAKRSTATVDIELCKRTAALLLGDPSGNGAVLRRDPGVNRAVLDFIMTSHDDPGAAWRQYREILKKEFKSEFHTLDA